MHGLEFKKRKSVQLWDKQGKVLKLWESSPHVEWHTTTLMLCSPGVRQENLNHQCSVLLSQPVPSPSWSSYIGARLSAAKKHCCATSPVHSSVHGRQPVRIQHILIHIQVCTRVCVHTHRKMCLQTQRHHSLIRITICCRCHQNFSCFV